MKYLINILYGKFLLVLIYLISGNSSYASDLNFSFDVGYIASNGHHDLVEKTYRDYDIYDSSLSWLYLRGTGSYAFNDHISLGLYTDIATNYIWGDVDYFNVIITPGISSRYRFNWDGSTPEERATGFFEAGIGIPVPFTDSRYYDFEYKNPSLRVEIGHEFSTNIELSLGYNYTPIEIDYKLRRPATENLGGAFIEFGLRF